ncbi:MAG: hypothetical protein AB1679_22135 [Actinomycetota bacterium]|jgi:hypothetical protein
MDAPGNERVREQGDRPSRAWIWLAVLVVAIVAVLMVVLAGGGGGGDGGVPGY